MPKKKKMSSTEAKSELRELTKRLKSLTQKRGEYVEQLAGAAGTLKTHEEERDRILKQCKDVGVDPKKLSSVIEEKIVSIGEAIEDKEERVQTVIDEGGFE